jgi:hypothetical protein
LRRQKHIADGRIHFKTPDHAAAQAVSFVAQAGRAAGEANRSTAMAGRATGLGGRAPTKAARPLPRLSVAPLARPATPLAWLV